MSNLPRIGITMGDPSGIGPELVLKVLSNEEVASACCPVVIGSSPILDAVAKKTGLSRSDVSLVEPDGDIRLPDPKQIVPGRVSGNCGLASYKYIERAVEMALDGTLDGIVTAPINKESLNLGGVHEPGHTEILARLTDTKTFAMHQHSSQIAVSFVTTHTSLADVPGILSRERIVEVGWLTNEFLHRLGVKEPCIGVCALNPHGGEGGIFGKEEEMMIVPAVKELQEEGVNAEGPLVPDAAFLEPNREHYDAFLSMYHDQGHIPFKMLSFHEGVNVTLGLPIIRTSVDHGTAYDIAWQGKADPGSMLAAIRLAVQLAGDSTPGTKK